MKTFKILSIVFAIMVAIVLVSCEPTREYSYYHYHYHNYHHHHYDHYDHDRDYWLP